MISTHDVSYYECHVTVEPVFDERLERFGEICSRPEFSFKVTRSSFSCIGHTDYTRMFNRMKGLVFALRQAGYDVQRYKIEAVVFDTRQGDTL